MSHFDIPLNRQRLDEISSTICDDAEWKHTVGIYHVSVSTSDDTWRVSQVP